MSAKTALERSLRALPRSLAARLTVWYTLSAFGLILGTTGLLYHKLLSSLDRQNDHMLADQVQVVRALLLERPDDVAGLRQEVEFESGARRYAQVYLRVLDAQGALVSETPGTGAILSGAHVQVPPAGDMSIGPGVAIHAPDGRFYRSTVARAACGSRLGSECVIQVAAERTQEAALVAAFRRRLFWVLGIGLVGCGVAGYAVARRGIHPVKQITRTARHIGSATLHERLRTSGLPAELSALAETFNAMLDRIEGSFGRLSRFSADIAHELRTPINNLRGEAEVALSRARTPEDYRDVLGSCLEECARLSAMIDALLFLARAESAEAFIKRGVIDAGAELARVQEFYDAAAAEVGITMRVDAEGDLRAHLDRTLFQRAVGNLVANALSHTPSGGLVTLSARRDAAALRVEVRDSGSGIAASDLPHVFERFYRADPSRSSQTGGVGLGLAIVHSIALLHGGSAEITSEIGRGTTARLIFPA